MRNKILAILLVLAVTSVAQANKTTQDTEIWVPVNINAKFGDTNWRGFLELQPRITNDVSQLGVIIVRPGIGYAITPNATIWAGYGLQATEYGDTGNYGLENRAWQGFYWKDTAAKKQFIWEMRNRMEERFLPANSEVSYRWRTRLRGEYLLQEYQPWLKPWSVIASNEVFVNFNSNTNNSQLPAGFNQNRAYVGIGYRFAPEFQIETGYLNQYVPGHVGKANQANNVWMTNFNVNF